MVSVLCATYKKTHVYGPQSTRSSKHLRRPALWPCDQTTSRDRRHIRRNGVTPFLHVRSAVVKRCLGKHGGVLSSERACYSLRGIRNTVALRSVPCETASVCYIVLAFRRTKYLSALNVHFCLRCPCLLLAIPCAEQRVPTGCFPRLSARPLARALTACDALRSRLKMRQANQVEQI